MTENLKSYIKDIIIVIVIVLAITFFLKPIVVKGISMQPNLQENNYLFISKQAYKFGEPKYGDIVVFPHDDGQVKELYIKRVIAVPGDVLTITGGEVYINGKKMDSSITNEGYTSGEIKNFEIPDGQIFVMGDNREHSSDSRLFGCVNIDDVTGKGLIRLYPFDELGFL